MPAASLPAHATTGELIITTDTNQIYIGKGPSSPLQIVAAGSGWHYGSGAPSTLYTDGDFYIDTATGDIWQQQSGSWVEVFTPAPGLPTGSGNKVVATPANGSSGVSILRALVAADIPTLSYDASGAASTAQTNAEAYTDSSIATEVTNRNTAIGVETSRAEAAEDLLAPLASPAFTGHPVGVTETALNNSTRLSTTAYTDAAVAVETSRAETAEALLAPKASPTFTGHPVGVTETALTNSTRLATTAYADSAVAVETSRAETAEALLAPLASPTFTGTVTLPSGQALVAPALGTPASGALTNCTSIPVANATGALPVANGGNPIVNTAPDCYMLPLGLEGMLAEVSNPTMGQNTGYAGFFQLPVSVTFTKMTINVGVAETTGGSNVYIGIYNMAGTLLVTGKFPVTASTTGAFGITVSSTTLNPGSYYILTTVDISGSTVRLTGASISTGQITTMLNKNQMRYGFKASILSSGALATPLTWSTFTLDAANLLPLVLLEP
jgi:hypothetical protein